MKRFVEKCGSCRLWGPSPRSHSLGGDRPTTATRTFQQLVQFFLLLFFSSPLWASPFDARLTQIEKTYTNTPALQAEFLQKTYIPLLEKTITRPGRIFYQRGGKIRIEYAGDKMTHYISDGKTLWVYDPSEKNLETYSLKDSGLPEEALNFLTELGNLRKYFDVSEGKEEKIILKPKQKSTYKQLVCVFDKDFYLEEITIKSLSGNSSHYHFFNREKKKSLPEKLFQP